MSSSEVAPAAVSRGVARVEGSWPKRASRVRPVSRSHPCGAPAAGVG